MELSEYHSIIQLYISLTKAYGWDTNQIDNMDLDIFFDYILVSRILDSQGDDGNQRNSVMDVANW